jgi:DNA-binding PadR family transcriptional regulator
MFEHFFHAERRSRMFAKGDIKYVILDLLKDKPSYGYEIIHSLEERFHGFYSPSAGSVYPTLQMLEDLDYVKSSERDGKKVYTVSDKGKEFLAEHKDVVHGIKNHMRDWWGEDNRDQLRDVFRELRSLVRLVSRRPQRLNNTKLKTIQEIVAEAYRNIEKVIDEE